jgi:hypothetical protein
MAEELGKSGHARGSSKSRIDASEKPFEDTQRSFEGDRNQKPSERSRPHTQRPEPADQPSIEENSVFKVTGEVDTDPLGSEAQLLSAKTRSTNPSLIFLEEGVTPTNITAHETKELPSPLLPPVLSPVPTLSEYITSRSDFPGLPIQLSKELPSPILPPVVSSEPFPTLRSIEASNKIAHQETKQLPYPTRTSAELSEPVGAEDEDKATKRASTAVESLKISAENQNQESGFRSTPNEFFKNEHAEFVKTKRGIFIPRPESRLRNNLLASVGFLEFGNATDFAANVWNTIPVPIVCKP